MTLLDLKPWPPASALTEMLEIAQWRMWGIGQVGSDGLQPGVTRKT